MGVFLLDDLTSYHECDEDSGTRFDAHVNGLDQVVVGSVNSVTGVGGVGKAVDGTGNSSNRLETASNSLYDIGDNFFTVVAWGIIRTGQQFGNNPLFARYIIPGGQSFALWGRSSVNKWRFSVSPDGTAETHVDGPTPTLNAWTMLTGIHDPVANVTKISANAGSFTTAAHSTGVHNPSSKIQLGGLGTTIGVGDIDKVGFWSRALNSEEISALYGGGTPPAFSSFVSSDAVDIAQLALPWYYR